MAVATAPAKDPKPRKKKEFRSAEAGQGRLAAMLISPTMLVLLAVIGFPIVEAFRQSLYRAHEGVDERGFVIAGDKFVGLQNYTDALTGTAGDTFWNAFYVTTMFTVVCVAIETVVGVAMALIMHRAFKGRALIRASILVPWAIPTAVSALLWAWIFNARGIANDLMNTQVLWSTDGLQAQLAVILADTWKTAPFIGLLTLAGLQVIPDEVYEAAKLDGVSAFKSFWHITLPLVKPALLVAVLFRMLDTLRMFDLPWVLIGRGKPSVETLSILAFEETTSSDFGPASAYAVMLFFYVALVAYAFVKLLGADVMGDAAERRKVRKARKKRRAATFARGDMS